MSKLEGHTIEAVREMTDEEAKDIGWYYQLSDDQPNPTVIVLDDGSELFASGDKTARFPGTLVIDHEDELYELTAPETDGE